MGLPDEVREAINVAQKEMLADSFHTLLPKQRLQIYKTTEVLEEPALTKFRTWLAILTAQKVLPFWKEEMPRNDLAQRILEVTEGLLVGNLTKKETEEDAEFFYNAVGNSDEYVEDGRARAALKTAYSALEAVLGYIPFSNFSPRQIENGFPDEIIAGPWLDAAGLGVLAYSSFAYDTSILEEKGFLLNHKEIEVLPLLEQNPDEKFDPEIRKEFWEWWLFEAIPQAWDLAHQN